jgi:integrase
MMATKYTGVKYHDAKDGTRSYYIQYKHNGKVKRQKVGTKEEGITPLYCKKLRDETLVKLRLGENAPIKTKNKVKTLSEISDEYFARNDLRTKSKMQSLYNTHLAHLGNEPLTYFDDNALLTLIGKKSKEKSRKTKRLLSKQTVNNITTLLSAMLHFAKSKSYIDALPTIKKLKVDNKRERYLTKEEIDTLFHEITVSPLVRKRERLLLFTKLSLVTGARLGSVLGIKGKDINRANKTVTIKNFKTNSTYTAFLPDDVLALIPPLKPQQLLIDVSDAKQLQRPLQRILNKLFNDDLNADDRKDRVVIHTLRHTFASHLAINGTPIHTIMKLMDHKDIDMTLRYAKLMPDSGRNEVENLYG